MSAEATARTKTSNDIAPPTSSEARQTIPPDFGRSGSLSRLTIFAGDIKIAHTIFALPFALLDAFLASGGFPKPGQLALILLCMVAAHGGDVVQSLARCAS